MNETESRLMMEYYDMFGECIVVNLMPEEDSNRLEDVLRECLEKKEPYDNYIEVPDEGLYD